MGVLMHDIGDVYRAKEQFDQAFIYYEKARKYKEEALKYKGDPDDLIRTLQTLTDVYAEINQHEKVLAVYEDVLGRLDSYRNRQNSSSG